MTHAELITTPSAAPPRESDPKTELTSGYELAGAFDEMFDRELRPRPHYQPLLARLRGMSPEEFRRRKQMTEISMRQEGVGFTVYQAEEGIERVWPMDPVPRIIPSHEWSHIESGLAQRLTALKSMHLA